MNKMICKKWLAALLCLTMMTSGALAQTYRQGDEADEIATIQTALTSLGLYSGSITGHFGAKTEEAVKKFQKRYALTDDGVVGEDTLKALYEAAGIDADVSSAPASSASGETALLKSGSRNEAVRKLQQDLTTLGYYSGNVTGHFGALTKDAVVKFQKANGLTADGVVGSKTLAKIAEKLRGGSSGSTGSSSSGTSAGSSSSGSASSGNPSLLKYGVKGSEAVRTLQQNLKTLGYYKTGSITGNYGNLTKEAVMRFQADNGLEADGVAGAKTLAKIAEKLKGSSSGSTGSSSSASSGTSYTAGTLYYGMKNSEEVKQLQINLTTLGFYSGNRTGNFGDLTREAVIKYQKSKGLTADGVAGKKTLAAIQADLNKGASGSTGGSASSGGSSLSARASQVQFSNFSNWRRRYDNGEVFTVFDPVSGLSWNLTVMTKDKHMDAEPATAQDTAIMNKAFGNVQTWTPKVIWATFSDGTTYIGSTHNVPHTPYHNRTNNFDGHLCVHFPRPMADAEATGPYATSHQEAILEGWEYTKSLMK